MQRKEGTHFSVKMQEKSFNNNGINNLKVYINISIFFFGQWQSQRKQLESKNKKCMNDQRN